MAPPLVDLSALNLTEDVLPEEELRRLLPHRHHFQMVDGVCHLDLEEGIAVAYKDMGEEPWWGAGHIPGRPIMPGVLQIEGVAQTGALLMKKMATQWEDRFIGLGGVNKARFRGVITPPGRVHWVAKVGHHSNRMARYLGQAFFDNKQIFEMELLGVWL